MNGRDPSRNPRVLEVVPGVDDSNGRGDRRGKIAPGKCVLNTHISAEEREDLRRWADEEKMTMTAFLRRLIWQERNRRRGLDNPQPNL